LCLKSSERYITLNPPSNTPDPPNPDSPEPIASNQPESVANLAELGAYLRKEREKQGITRSEISSRTKITIDQLNNLEAGTFTGLAPVYAKGFLRSYAQTINLDPAWIIQEYKKHTSQVDSDPRKPLVTKYREIDLTGDNGISFGATLAVIAIIIIVFALLLIFNPTFHNFAADFLPFVDPVEISEDNSVDTDDTSDSSFESSETAAPVTPGSSLGGNTSGSDYSRPSPPQSLEPLAAPATIPLRPLGPTPTPPPENSDTSQNTPPSSDQDLSSASLNTPPPVTPGGKLTLTAVKSTWGQVSVDNGPLQHVFFKEGETRSFVGEKSVTLTCGDGRAIQAMWNGQDMGFVGTEGPMEITWPPARG
jgi:cytoskeleton protein RodZ